MKNSILFVTLSFFVSQNAFGQTLADAVRYSLLEVGGTAATVGVGGGVGALGGDFSVLSTNPAGLGAYRKSVFTCSPSFERTTTEGTLEGTSGSQDRSKLNFNFNNLGLVIASQPLDAKWKTVVFGLGMNRLANFHERTYFEGKTPGSITDRWLELAGDLPDGQLDEFEAGPAHDVLAIYDPNPFYLSDFLDADGNYGNIPVTKSQLIKRTGSINELVFSYAGNYDEKWMIGATLGVPLLSFEETRTYKESDEPDEIGFFDELEYIEKLRTTGAGINLKFGLIYKLDQTVRLGAAIHTPTSYNLDDSYSTEITYGFTDFNGSSRETANSPDANFEYRLRTPWRAIGSAGFLVKKVGFFTAEAEYVDYKSAKFNFTDGASTGDVEYQRELNGQIDTALTSALNLRFGGEFALQKFRFRAGYAITASPYDANDEKTGSLSLGAGVRWESVFLDFAFRRQTSERSYVPYAVNFAPEPSVNLNGQRNQFLLTVGFKL